MKIKEYLKLMRPHQYLKNTFIFAPLFFSLKIDNIEQIIDTLIAFFLFSILASSVYIFNDYMDIEDDRNHPIKKYRPLASGAISKGAAIALMVGLVAITFLTCLFFLNLMTVYLLLIYLLLNLLYSWRLKHISLVDIFIISIGFVLRIFVGSYSGNIGLSHWIIVMTFLLSLFLAFAKRRDDVLLFLETGTKSRKNTEAYNLDFINSAMSMLSSIIMVAYILYTISPEIILKYKTDKLYITSVFVIFGILRYKQITFVYNDSGAPTKTLMKDKFIQLSILLWVFSFLLIRFL